MPEAEFRAAATTVIENYGNYEEAMEQALAENSVDVLQEIAAPVMQPALDNYRHQLFLARVEINELQAAGVAHYNQEYLNELNDFAAEMAINQPVPNEVLVFKAHYQERVQYFFDVYNAGYDYDRAFVIIDLLVTTAILLAALAGELDNDSGDDGSPQQGNLVYVFPHSQPVVQFIGRYPAVIRFDLPISPFNWGISGTVTVGLVSEGLGRRGSGLHRGAGRGGSWPGTRVLSSSITS